MRTIKDYHEYLDSLLEDYYLSAGNVLIAKSAKPSKKDAKIIVISDDEKYACERKLIYDELAEYDVTETKITFKGIVFFLEGGYTKRRKNEKLLKSRKIAETVFLIIGSVGAFGILILEYIKFHQSCLCP